MKATETYYLAKLEELQKAQAIIAKAKTMLESWKSVGQYSIPVEPLLQILNGKEKIDWEK
jgi:hypothetical protein